MLVFRMGTDTFCDSLRRNRLIRCLPRPGRSRQHPLCPNQAICVLNRLANFLCHGAGTAGADAHNCNLRPSYKTIALTQQGHGIRERQSRPLGRTAHYHQRGPCLFRSGGLFCKTAGIPTLFRNQVPGMNGPQQGHVQLFAEGALHSNDVGRSQPCRLA